MSKFINSPKGLLILFSLFFAILPFFWFHPGEMDLGGDSNRLYFYDPLSFLRYSSSSMVETYGMGAIDPTYYFIPYLLLLAGLKALVQSPYILISFFNVLKLLGGFLAMYFVIRELLKISSGKKNDIEKRINQYAALLGALFYILSPLATSNWDKALTSHNQIFLNPWMFFFLLKFFTSHNLRYAWFGILISFLFAPNFGFTSTPPIFAFYPLALVFLVLLMILQKIKFPSWKKIATVVVFFLGLHAFHLIPQIVSLFEPGSYANTRVFDRASIAQEGIRYFVAILPLAKVSERVLLPSINTLLPFIFVLVPVMIILSFVFNNKKQKILLVTGGFFLLTLYLLTANITNMGIKLYEGFFYLPGFTMFRNFIGQWGMVFIFFYTLLFGLSTKVLFSRFTRLSYNYIVLGVGLLFIFSSWRFISGDAVTKGYVTNNVRIPIQMDPAYESTLQHIKAIPDESKILMLPYTDAFYQVLAGENGGAYVGPSTIAYTTGKKTFTGYQLMPASFSDRFFSLAKMKDYEGIKKLFVYLNIRYIFYNSDPRIYDDAFPSTPYSYARESLPKTQKEYKEFLSHIVDKKIFEKGSYQVFSLNKNEYLPLFYIAKQVGTYSPVVKNTIEDTSSFLENKSDDVRTVYINKQNCVKLTERKDCPVLQQNTTAPTISFTRVNSTKYIVEVANMKEPYLLTFLNMYHPKWKVFVADNINQKLPVNFSYFNQEIQEGVHKDALFNNPFETLRMKEIAISRHTVANGYANVWLINPEDVGGKTNYTLLVEMTGQRTFYYSGIVSVIMFLLFVSWGILLFFSVQIAGIMKGIHASIGQKKI